MRQYGEACQVETEPSGDGGFRPVQVTWRERTAVVAEVLEYWVQARVWWQDPEPAVKRDYWWWRVRLVAESGSLIVDLREDEGTWTVEHLLD